MEGGWVGRWLCLYGECLVFCFCFGDFMFLILIDGGD